MATPCHDGETNPGQRPKKNIRRLYFVSRIICCFAQLSSAQVQAGDFIMEMFEYSDPAGAKSVPNTQPLVAALAEFGAEDWAALREFAAERRYMKGATILPAADAPPALNIVTEGAVQVNGGAGETTLAAGGMFGVSRFLDPNLPDVTAATPSGAVVLMLTQPGLNRLAAWRPRTGILLLGALGALLSRQWRDAGRSF